MNTVDGSVEGSYPSRDVATCVLAVVIVGIHPGDTSFTFRRGFDPNIRLVDNGIHAADVSSGRGHVTRHSGVFSTDRIIVFVGGINH